MITRSFAAAFGSCSSPPGDIEVVGEAGTAEQALDRVPLTSPDVAVLDVQLPDGSGVEVCRELVSSNPSLGCLMLTSFTDDEALLDAVIAGAKGYVLKDVRGLDIVESVRKVAAGESLLDPTLVERARERLRRGAEEDDRLKGLTPQEHRILSLLAEGRTNRQIAEEYVPGREDGQELRVEPAGEDGHEPPHRGGRSMRCDRRAVEAHTLTADTVTLFA